MFRGRGKLLLFADADGATTFSEYDQVEDSLRSACKGLAYVIALRECLKFSFEFPLLKF